jgi:hypothetical protein
MATLKESLIAKAEEILIHMEDDRPDTVLTIENAMRLDLDPTELWMRGMNDWQEFIATTRDYQAELSPWVFPIPAATGMQMVFLNLVANFWVDNPPATDEKLNPVVQEAVETYVSAYTDLITI